MMALFQNEGLTVQKVMILDMDWSVIACLCCQLISFVSMLKCLFTDPSKIKQYELEDIDNGLYRMCSEIEMGK